MAACRLIPVLAAMLFMVSSRATVDAHTLADLERVLGKQEFYVQITNRPAPEFSLQDANGARVSLADFRGKVVILNFIYGSCKEACPLHSDVIAGIQRMANSGPLRDSVQFISITTDPERDTADVLKAYGEAHGLDPVNWIFLTSGAAKPTETRELGEQYGLKFTRTGDGDFIHGVVTHIIDGSGILRARFHGLEFDPANLVAYVTGLSTGDYEGAARLLGSHEPTRPSNINITTDTGPLPAQWWLPAGIGLATATMIALFLIWRPRRKRPG